MLIEEIRINVMLFLWISILIAILNAYGSGVIPKRRSLMIIFYYNCSACFCVRIVCKDASPGFCQWLFLEEEEIFSSLIKILPLGHNKKRGQNIL